MAIYNLGVAHVLGLTDSLIISPKILSLTQTLSFTQSTSKSIHHQVVQQSLLLQQVIKSPSRQLVTSNLQLLQSVSVKKINTRAVTHLLSFESKAARVKLFENIAHILIFQHYVRTPIISTLNLTQSVIVHRGKALSDTLDIIDSVSVKKILKLSITQNLLLNSFALPEINNCNFVQVPIPVTTPRSYIELIYNNVTLQLRAPNFNNINRLEHSRIFRRSRGGDFHVFRDPIWPKTENLTYQFSFLKEEDSQKLLKFLRDSLGKNITLIDYETITWQGIILTPDAPVSENSRGNFSGSFEFQGSMV